MAYPFPVLPLWLLSVMRTGADRKRKAKSLSDTLQVPVLAMLMLRCKHSDNIDCQNADDTRMYDMPAQPAGTLAAQS